MIFCVCGGILEVGVIAAFFGWIGRVIFKKAKKCEHKAEKPAELPKATAHEKVPVS